MSRSEATDPRSRSFGSVAAAYEQFRPAYPPAAVDLLLAHHPSAALDVGCGTSKLGRAIAERGVRVLGVEPDPRMAEVARRSLEVEVAAFEAWDGRGRRFDLVAAGESWHWIDPTIGASRLQEVLDPGGRFAAVANVFRPDPASASLLDEVYRRNAPALDPPSKWADHGRASMDLIANRPLPGFDPLEVHVVTWEHRHSPSEWIGRFFTSSIHLQLDRAVRDRLASDIDESMTGRDGVHGQEETVVVLTHRT